MASLRREPSADSEWSFIPYEDVLVLSEDEDLVSISLKTFIQGFVGDVGAPDVLRQDDVALVSNVLYEVFLNAYQHEGVRHVGLESGSEQIMASYSSSSGYGLAQLLGEDVGRGGFDAVEMLADETQGRVTLNFRAAVNESDWIFTLMRLGFSEDPCAINLRGRTPAQRALFVSECSGCETVHVHGHLHDYSSDNWATARYVKELVDGGYRVVVHSKPGPLARHLQRTIREVLEDGQNFDLVEHG